MKVKICGITTFEDAVMVAEAGADMLGFNFYAPSPRYIHPEVCRELVQKLVAIYTNLTLVGVFVNSSCQEIISIMDSCHLDLAQLCGDEPVETLMQLGEKGFKAYRPKTMDDFQSALAAAPERANPPAFLVDSFQRGSFGGSGQTADWSLAKQIAQKQDILLAGGLTPENVAQAARQVQPWGVDVASGVESAPGRKDPQKTVDFIQAVRNLEGETC